MPLYDKQIPPGAAQVVHYALDVPRGRRAGRSRSRRGCTTGSSTATMMRFAMGEAYRIDLPVTTIASGRGELPARAPARRRRAQPAWERWNDYGIGLLLEGNDGSDKGELRQAEAAFAEVERLGRPEGPLNLARVYHKEGRLDEAARRSARARPPAPRPGPWLADRPGEQGERPPRRGHRQLQAALDATSPELRARGFDFSRDYEVLNELGQTLFERAKQERGPARAEAARGAAAAGRGAFDRTLAIDTENVDRALRARPDPRRARRSGARRRAPRGRTCATRPTSSRATASSPSTALRNPAANHAAQSIVIYDLQRRPDAGPPPRPRPRSPPDAARRDRRCHAVTALLRVARRHRPGACRGSCASRRVTGARHVRHVGTRRPRERPSRHAAPPARFVDVTRDAGPRRLHRG